MKIEMIEYHLDVVGVFSPSELMRRFFDCATDAPPGEAPDAPDEAALAEYAACVEEEQVREAFQAYNAYARERAWNDSQCARERAREAAACAREARRPPCAREDECRIRSADRQRKRASAAKATEHWEASRWQ